MGDGGRGRVGRRAGGGALGQDVDLNARFLVNQLGPQPHRRRGHFKTAQGRHAEQFFDARGGHDDVHVLGHPPQVAVPPNGPSTGHDRLGVGNFQEVVQRSDDTPVAARQVLWLEHRVPSGAQRIAELQLRGEHLR